MSTFNARLGLSVGTTPTTVIDASGNVTAGTITANSGSFNNAVTITGTANFTVQPSIGAFSVAGSGGVYFGDGAALTTSGSTGMATVRGGSGVTLNVGNNPCATFNSTLATLQGNVLIGLPPTNQIGIQLGNASVTGMIGTRYSAGSPVVSSNAIGFGSDNWSQGLATFGSLLLDMHYTLGLNIYYAAVGKASGTFNSFWGTPVFSVSPTGLLTATEALISGGRSIHMNASSGSVGILAPSSGGWSEMLGTRNTGDTAFIGAFGTYGVGNTVSYSFIGTDYNTTWQKFYPDGSIAVGATTITSPDSSYQIMLQGSLAGASNQYASLAFSDAGNNSLDIRTHYQSSTNQITISPSNSIAATFTTTGNTFSVPLTISPSLQGNMLFNGPSNWPQNLVLSTSWSGTYNDYTKISVPGSSANSSFLILSGPGNAYCSGSFNGTGFNNTSDARLKTNIEVITGAIEKLSAIRGVTFNWTEASGIKGDHQIGVLAQEVREVIPQAVTEHTDEQSLLSVDYGKLTPLLIEAIKEQQNTIEALTSRIIALEKKLN